MTFLEKFRKKAGRFKILHFATLFMLHYCWLYKLMILGEGFSPSISMVITRWFKTEEALKIKNIICGRFKMGFKFKCLKFHHKAWDRDSTILFHSNDHDFPDKHRANLIRKWSVGCNSQLCIDFFAKIVMGWREPLM